jgi:hypothetical protein
VRFDLRLRGLASGGRKCLLETSVYATSQAQLQERAAIAATEGPWFYEDTNEPVPEGEHITVERVERSDGKRRSGDVAGG